MSIHEKRGSHSISAQKSSVLNFERPLTEVSPEIRLDFVLKHKGLLISNGKAVDETLRRTDPVDLSFSGIIKGARDPQLHEYARRNTDGLLQVHSVYPDDYQLLIYHPGLREDHKKNVLPAYIQSVFAEHRKLIDQILEEFLSEITGVCERSKGAIDQFNMLLRLEEEKILTRAQKLRLLINHRKEPLGRKGIFRYSSPSLSYWESLLPTDVVEKIHSLHTCAMEPWHYYYTQKSFQDIISNALHAIYQKLLNQKKIEGEEIEKIRYEIRQRYHWILRKIESRKQYLGISETDPNPPQTPRGYR